MFQKFEGSLRELAQYVILESFHKRVWCGLHFIPSRRALLYVGDTRSSLGEMMPSRAHAQSFMSLLITVLVFLKIKIKNKNKNDAISTSNERMGYMCKFTTMK
jgi:hypothetical protein